VTVCWRVGIQLEYRNRGQRGRLQPDNTVFVSVRVEKNFLKIFIFLVDKSYICRILYLTNVRRRFR